MLRAHLDDELLERSTQRVDDAGSIRSRSKNAPVALQPPRVIGVRHICGPDRCHKCRACLPQFGRRSRHCGADLLNPEILKILRRDVAAVPQLDACRRRRNLVTLCRKRDWLCASSRRWGGWGPGRLRAACRVERHGKRDPAKNAQNGTADAELTAGVAFCAIWKDALAHECRRKTGRVSAQ